MIVTRSYSKMGLFAVVLLGAAFASGQGPVAKSAADAKPIAVGAMAPDARLLAIDGKAVRLHDVLGGKPTVLIFYRGGWCPFCNRHLADVQTVAGDIKDRGYQIVAVTPDSPAELTKTLNRHDLTYTLLSDTDSQAMRQYGVAFRLDDPTFNLYKDKYHIDLERSSGNKRHILPVPSVFVVDAAGKIIFAHSNPDYKVRMKGSEIIAAIDANKAGR